MVVAHLVGGGTGRRDGEVGGVGNNFSWVFGGRFHSLEWGTVFFIYGLISGGRNEFEDVVGSEEEFVGRASEGGGV